MVSLAYSCKYSCSWCSCTLCFLAINHKSKIELCLLVRYSTIKNMVVLLCSALLWKGRRDHWQPSMQGDEYHSPIPNKNFMLPKNQFMLLYGKNKLCLFLFSLILWAKSKINSIAGLLKQSQRLENTSKFLNVNDTYKTNSMDWYYWNRLRTPIPLHGAINVSDRKSSFDETLIKYIWIKLNPVEITGYICLETENLKPRKQGNVPSICYTWREPKSLHRKQKHGFAEDSLKSLLNHAARLFMGVPILPPCFLLFRTKLAGWCLGLRSPVIMTSRSWICNGRAALFCVAAAAAASTFTVCGRG